MFRTTSRSSMHSHVDYFNIIILSDNDIVCRTDMSIIDFSFLFGCTHIYFWICLPSKNPCSIVRSSYFQMSIDRVTLSFTSYSAYGPFFIINFTSRSIFHVIEQEQLSSVSVLCDQSAAAFELLVFSVYLFICTWSI